MSNGGARSKDFVAKQYRDGSHVDARIHFHKHYSVNRYGFHRWVFDQFEMPPECSILELGCGPGTLWLENRDRMPTGWQVLLTDFSEGMAQQTEQNLRGDPRFQFRVVDAQSQPLPFADKSFGAVIANHMLYYMANRSDVLREIRRILKPGGRFYASTLGERNLAEIVETLAAYDDAFKGWSNGASGEFSLENGARQISPAFPNVALRLYEDAIEVSEAGPLFDYVMSTEPELSAEKAEGLKDHLSREIRSRGGVFRSGKCAGMFIASREMP